MTGTIIFILLLVGFMAALGRGTMPKAERLPWTRWGAKDLIANMAIGARRLVQLHERDPRNTPLDAFDGRRRGSSVEGASHG